MFTDPLYGELVLSLMVACYFRGAHLEEILHVMILVGDADMMVACVSLNPLDTQEVLVVGGLQKAGVTSTHTCMK